MPSEVKVYTIGTKGVNVDKDPLLLDDDELQTAQNFTHDPTAGHRGALRVRPGLNKWNTVYAGGAILGGITVQAHGTGGAPINLGGGGGFPGGTGGTGGGGGGTGGGPGGGDASGTGGPGSIGGGPFTNPGLFPNAPGGPPARLIAIGRYDTRAAQSDPNPGVGWWVTDSGANQLAIVLNRLRSQNAPRYLSYPSFSSSGSCGTPSVVYNGALYYGGYALQQADFRPTIRTTDGLSDRLIATIPKNQYATAANNPGASDFSQQAAILAMSSGAGLIMISIADRINLPQTSGATNEQSRIFVMDPASGAMTEVNLGAAAATPVSYQATPYTLAYWNGRIWWGDLGSGANNANDNPGTINATSQNFATGRGTATLDFTLPTQYKASCMAVLQGILFVGTVSLSATPVTAKTYYRTVAQPIGGAGAWTANTAPTGIGTIANSNYYHSMVVFNPSLSDPTQAFLLASYYNSGGAIIQKFAPNLGTVDSTGSWTGATTISTVYTEGGTPVPYNLFVDNQIIYAVASSSASLYKVLKSTDGTTWTDVSANFPILNSDYYTPILFGFSQQ